MYISDPKSICHILKQISSYAERNGNPSKKVVIGALSETLRSLRTSASLEKFTEKEYEAVYTSLSDLVKRLEKVSQTINSQDPDKQTMLSGIEQLKEMISQFDTVFDKIKSINV